MGSDRVTFRHSQSFNRDAFRTAATTPKECEPFARLSLHMLKVYESGDPSQVLELAPVRKDSEFPPMGERNLRFGYL